MIEVLTQSSRNTSTSPGLYSRPLTSRYSADSTPSICSVSANTSPRPTQSWSADQTLLMTGAGSVVATVRFGTLFCVVWHTSRWATDRD